MCQRDIMVRYGPSASSKSLMAITGLVISPRALMGTESCFVYKFNKGQYTVNDEICLSHLTPVSK